MKTKEDKSNWIVDYQKEFPIIKLTDCNGIKQTINVNDIISIETGKLAKKSLEIINKLI